jgi:hypothetical protein
VTCLHLMSDKRVMFGTQEGVVGALEVSATTSTPSTSLKLELHAPVCSLACSPDGRRIAAATEYVPLLLY